VEANIESNNDLRNNFKIYLFSPPFALTGGFSRNVYGQPFYFIIDGKARKFMSLGVLLMKLLEC